MTDWRNDKKRNDFQESAYVEMEKHSKEPEVCKYFACGRVLTLEETMYGDYCREHSVRKEVDIINVIRFH